MPDDQLSKQLAAVEQQGKTRYGEATWNKMLAAVQRAAPQGLSPAEMQGLINTGDAAGAIATIHRHQLLDEASGYSNVRKAEMDADRRAAELEYSEMRNAERDAWRKAHGR